MSLLILFELGFLTGLAAVGALLYAFGVRRVAQVLIALDDALRPAKPISEWDQTARNLGAKNYSSAPSGIQKVIREAHRKAA